MSYDKIAWLPLCGGLTGLGLVLSYLVMRRRGLGSGLRGAAFSLLPLAAYLTGAVKMIWQMGVAIGDFAKGFAFSLEVWSGIAVTGVAVLLFFVSGPLRRRTLKRNKGQRAVGPDDASAKRPAVTGAGQLATRPAAVAATAPVKARKGKSAGSAHDDDDDLGDVEDILRRHGIS